MIAPFDLFGKKRYRYTFQMKCKEEDMWLEDGVTRIFLNTKGENPQDVNPELVELLHYFEKTTDEVAADCESERIKELHERIRRIKTSEEIGVRYMPVSYTHLDVYKRQMICCLEKNGIDGRYWREWRFDFLIKMILRSHTKDNK